MLLLALVAGLVLLVGGGDMFVRGSVGIAEKFNVSPMIIGLTLVGFGTSTPELMTSVLAAINDAPGIAVGNIVGSNTANILLILGVAALIYPLATEPKVLARDGAVVALAGLVCLAVAVAGHVGRVGGLLMILVLVGYVFLLYRQAVGARAPEPFSAEVAAVVAQPHPRNVWLLALLMGGGFALTLLGAHWVVVGATGLASRMGVSDTIVGLTIVAVGTSLPELVTSVVAALRRQSDIALGNIFGSNIYNILGILGVTAIVQPISVPDRILGFDVWVMLGATALLLIFARTGCRISRAEGGTLLGLYAAYLASMALV